MEKTLTKEKKAEIVKQHGKTPLDTGAPEVQIALLSNRIKLLTPHFGENKKDHQGRRGLLKLVGQRRRLLNYVRSRSEARYQGIIDSLGLRK